MKQFLKIIFTILLAQICWSGIDLCAAQTDTEAVSLVNDANTHDADGLTGIADEPVSQVYAYPMDQTTTSGLQTMARRMRSVSSRIQFISRDNILFVKTLIGHLSRHQSMLTACANRTFSSLRPFCWEAPADCYVFGIRHIII